MSATKNTPKGRGASINPANRFEKFRVDPDDGTQPDRIKTVFFRDDTQSVISNNESPDIGFNQSLNPYRGCEHGCAYCYARPYHEYLGFSSGTDFESKIMIKNDAPELLRKALSNPRYQPRPLALSGVTDCYQPVERKLKITRGCLSVLADFRHPVSVVTKNALVTRDIDHLASLAELGASAVYMSITSLDSSLARKMEPRASSPRDRLRAIKELTDAGIPTGVMVAPIIPTLNEPELADILKAAADAGAKVAGYTVVRLPHAVKSVFEQWLTEHFPTQQAKIMGRIETLQGGESFCSKQFGDRMRGSGIFANQIARLFETLCRKHGMNKERLVVSSEHFRRLETNQLELFP